MILAFITDEVIEDNFCLTTFLCGNPTANKIFENLQLPLSMTYMEHQLHSA